MFQSSPGPRAGRCIVVARAERDVLCSFNPRPARGPGAAAPSPNPDRGRVTVSILARPAGRALPPPAYTSHRSCNPGFNPRPARGPGAAVLPHHRPQALHRVSILARPAGRALPGREDDVDALRSDVSILARPAGRALPGGSRTRPRGTPWRFNPRPARGPGAASTRSDTLTTTTQFQSSPGPRAGRCRAGRTPLSEECDPFQSSPGPRAGRCLQAALSERRVDARVSILARPAGRALRPQPAILGVDELVVSILARPAGRALLPERGVLECLVDDVSILARPAGRALHVREPSGSATLVSFQSSPGPRAGRCSFGGSRTILCSSGFQSSPGPRAGRCWRPSGSPTNASGFQSSPGPRAGRCAGRDPRLFEVRDVSILARPAGRALPGTGARRGRR